MIQPTVDGLALCHVAVVGSSEKAVAVATNDPLDVPVLRQRLCLVLFGLSLLPIVNVEEEALHFAATPKLEDSGRCQMLSGLKNKSELEGNDSSNLENVIAHGPERAALPNED